MTMSHDLEADACSSTSTSTASGSTAHDRLHPDSCVQAVLSPLATPITASTCTTNETDDDVADLFDFDFSTGALSDLTPLLKEEIKYKIQHKRLMEGKSELMVEYKDPNQAEQLTPDDIHRRKKRKANNRKAAQRCRSKKKERAEELLQETQLWEEKNENLQDQIDSLKEERDKLNEMLEIHEPLCKYPKHN